MTIILLVQLPVPQNNFGMKTGNVLLAGALLAQAAQGISGVYVDMVPEYMASYLGDQALIDYIVERQPDVVGFTVFAWNIDRSLWMSQQLKQSCNAAIIMGGPEITEDNPRLPDPYVDFYVYGEGEAVFSAYLKGDYGPSVPCASETAEQFFLQGRSPYLEGFIDPLKSDIVYVESQRGCPYSCGFCYYNKGRSHITALPAPPLTAVIKWAREKRVSELCFIDPSLNVRKDLRPFLKEISRINKDGQLALTGEIRAETLSPHTADLFQQAGFAWFEIGLQTTNPKALRVMNRKTDLEGFVRGTTLLKERDMVPRIDLIVGLPGDTLTDFKTSVDFVHDHDLAMDVQVFPLAVLPGTDFRRNSRELGMAYEPCPPYTIRHTPSFSQEDILQAFDYAESAFDVALFPDADIVIPFQAMETRGKDGPGDVTVDIDGRRCIRAVNLHHGRCLEEMEDVSKKLTTPYQVIIQPDLTDPERMAKALRHLSSANPYTPLEIIFIEPATIPHTKRLMEAIHIRRPHYLDNDLRFIYGRPGNRAVIFTVLSEKETICFSGEMKRQVFWWKKSRLPSPDTLDDFWEFHGMLIDTPLPDEDVIKWQDRVSPAAHDHIEIGFAAPHLQRRWMSLTCTDAYAADLMI